MMPFTVIGGYLGAGKTTLVNHLLRHAGGVRIAVLVNEFGALPIDADLIEAEGDDMIAIAGGCVCCSYGSDLLRAIRDLSRLDPPPDHVLLEASGVALPGAIAASVTLVPGCGLDAVVVLADAETLRDQAEDAYIGDTILRQLADADLVLLNKIDLVPADVRAELGLWLAGRAPNATVIETEHGRIASEIILQKRLSTATRSAGGPLHATTGYRSAALPLPQEVDANRVAGILADSRLGLVRAKGFARTRDGLRTIQVVGRRWSVSAAPEGAKPGLVVISCDPAFDPRVVEAAIGAP